MIDSIRQSYLNGQMDGGMDYKDALIGWNLGQTFPVGIIKDELEDIIESSWQKDFMSKFRVVCECDWCRRGYPGASKDCCFSPW